MYATNEQQERSRQSLVAQAMELNEGGHRYLRAREDARKAVAAKQAYEKTHGAVGHVPMTTIVEYVIYAVGLLCAYGIDVLLFGGPAEYTASLLSGESTLWSAVAKYTVPAFFLGLEILISMKIERSRHEERFEFGSAAARKFWIGLGIVVALVMPLVARAAAESVGVVAEGAMNGSMVAVLAIISFAAHVLVLFGGRTALEAKTYLVFALFAGLHEKRTARAEQRASALLAAMNATFIAYVHAWRTHNARYGSMPSGPFDDGVLALLHQQFSTVTFGQHRGAFPTVFDPEDTETAS